MAKRFSDTDIWKKSWFRKLTPTQKTALRYILDTCDTVGVWEPDFEHAEFCIGGPVDWNGLVENCNKNLEILPNDKWWVVDFCFFQYGPLMGESRPHQSYMKLLEKHGLLDRVSIGYTKGMDEIG